MTSWIDPLHPPTHPRAVAYGVIAGLAAYIAIHAPFWMADYIHKRWRGWRGSGAGGESPRLSSRLKRYGQLDWGCVGMPHAVSTATHAASAELS